MTEAGKCEWRQAEYTISTDNARLHIWLIHDFISNHSYWARGRKIETVKRALDNSLNFGLYKNNQQIGFARLATDYCTFAWLANVFIVDDNRGRGLSKWLIEVITSYPALGHMRRWVFGH